MKQTSKARFRIQMKKSFERNIGWMVAVTAVFFIGCCFCAAWKADHDNSNYGISISEESGAVAGVKTEDASGTGGESESEKMSITGTGDSVEASGMAGSEYTEGTGIVLVGDNGVTMAGDTTTADGVTTEEGSIAVNEAPVFSADDWRLLLVNKQNYLPEDYEFEFGEIDSLKGTLLCDARIIEDLELMFQGAKDEGITLEICSAYRDRDYQAMLFDRKVKQYQDKGYTYEEAFERASRLVTFPGASEHQSGLALDIVCDTHKTLNWAFADTDAGKWLAANCHKYGFILRYPEGKEDITEISYEPWHFRYVGVEAATIIMEKEITLEEFLEEYL